ncbi:MAG: hypothetical protein GY717_08880 [Rhodobacteraceae bacterium]|nr:hypothetical protein [Paracoccaceae bacterium]
MKINEVPRYDSSINTTGCCAKFNPDGWGGRQLSFRDKPFLRAATRSVMHIPVNMGSVFTRVRRHMEQAGPVDEANTLVLSHELSSWRAEHLFATDKPVEGEEMVTLTGNYITKVFEGPYREAKRWHDTMLAEVKAQGGTPGKVWFFYTTCPKCAKVYGKNYVVGVAETV